MFFILKAGANGCALQVGKLNHCPVFDENAIKLWVVPSPINHGTGHGRAFARVQAIFKEFEAGIIKKANPPCVSKNTLFPMACVGGHRNQRQDFRSIFLVGQRTFGQPIFNARSSQSVSAIRRIHIDRGVVPFQSEPVFVRKHPFRLGLNDGTFVGTRVEGHGTAKELLDGLNIFQRRSPTLILGMNASPGAHGFFLV